MNQLPLLPTTEERLSHISQLPLSQYSPSQLSQITSYLLYHEKLYSPYSKDSTNLPLEVATNKTEENTTNYTVPRIPVDWTNPTLSSLLQAKTQVNELAQDSPPHTARKLKKVSIELSQDAKYILQSFNPYINPKPQFQKATPINIEDYIDWTNSYHIKHLLLHYSKLRQSDESKITIEFFDKLIDFAKLEPWQMHLIKRRIDGAKLPTIGGELARDYNKIVSPSYMSQAMRGIYRHIARAADQFFQEFEDRNNRAAWKKCPSCGEILHNSKWNFYKGKNKCKRCVRA